MNSTELRSLQAPLKEHYETDPTAARVTLTARGVVDPSTIACRIEGIRTPSIAGLHPATGGSGQELCSGDMLLEALVACAGVTLKAVATALDIPLRSASILAEGDLDFRGTLGLAKDVPVGFSAIRLTYQIDTEAPLEKLEQLLKLTERYCVVFQTLRSGVPLQVQLSRSA